MKHALWLPLCLSLLAVPARADDTDTAAIAAARAYVLAALPGECDDSTPGAAPADAAFALSWKPDWGDGTQPDERATLYQIFCFAGAYNEIFAFVFKPENGNLSLLSFAQPTFKIEYAEADELQTELKGPPKVTGFSTTATLVNAGFDAATNTLSSFSKWRGLGDAWAAGSWQLADGQFVLTSYAIDPIYEANLDEATDEQMDQSFQLYP